MNNINYKDIMNYIDINENDRVFISSDITRLVFNSHLSGEEFDANIFIDSIINKVGKNGTVIFPTYNWDFCNGTAFDYFKTKSKVGALTNICLNRKDFKRTRHPIYSFAVWGKDCDLLCSMDNISSFGPDSPFAYFYYNEVKNLAIDLKYGEFETFVHSCEEKIGVPYRYLKNFTSNYLDENGYGTEKTYSMYVRNLDMQVSVDVSPMQRIFIKNKISIDYKINDIGFILLDMHKAYNLVEEDIKNNKSRNICTYLGQEDE